MQAKQYLNPGSPKGEKRAVAPGRRPNTVYRKREHLTPAEVAKLIDTARCNRYGQRDATMILLAYRHGFRASEVCDLEWSAIDFARAEMHVSRRKAGKPATHPIRGDELRELRKLRKEFDGIIRFRERTRCALHAGLFQLDDQAGWSKGRCPALPGSCPHAAAQRRLQARR